LLETSRITEGSFTYLAMALGRRVVSWQDQYDPSVANAVDADRLHVTDGAPIHRGRNWFYDEAGQVVEYGESATCGRITYRGDVED
jgi:DNA-binding GntR family transcriptional regulator